jgi:hypothetical protein
MHGVIPDLPEGGVVSPPSSTLCATTRWPSAMTDRGCAKRLDDIRPRKWTSSRTKKPWLGVG